MKFASYPSHAEQMKFKLGKKLYFTLNKELEIVLATEKEYTELAAIELIQWYPYYFIVNMKEKKDTIIFECKISDNFKDAYGKYAAIEVMTKLVTLWLRT